jgi:hypothetical protein
MTMGTSARIACLTTLLLGGARGAVTGDEAGRTNAMTLRLFDVSALVAGKLDFVGEHVGVVGRMEGENEPRGMPAEAEEPVLPLGTIEELIQLLKTEVLPESWTESAALDARPMGGRTLVVRQSAEAHAAIGAALRAWEERHLRSITYEVQAIRPTDDPLPAGNDVVAARVERSVGEPGISVAALLGQRVAAFGGVRSAFVHAYDLSSAGKSSCADPIVGVVNLGLGVDLRAVPAAGDRLHVWVHARLAQSPAWETSSVGGAAEVQVARFDAIAIEQQVELRPGRWTMLDGAPRVGGAGGWTFAIRAVVDPRAPGPAGAGLDLPHLESGDFGPLATRHFSSALFEPAPSWRQGADEEAIPTGWFSIGREHLDPVEPCAPDAFIELAKETLQGDSWPEDSQTLIQNRTVVMRAPARVVTTLGKTIEILERALVRSVSVEAEVLDVPADLPLTGDGRLSEEEAQALASAVAAGDARKVDHLRLTSTQGANNTIAAGELLSYVQDVDPLSTECCEPVTRRRPLRDGATLEVGAIPTSTGDSVLTTVRFLRTWVKRPLGVAETSLGEIQTPEVRTVRLRTSLVVPLDATAVVGSAVADGRRTLLLLTPRLRRSGD